MSKLMEITAIFASEKRFPNCGDFFIATLKPVNPNDASTFGPTITAVGNAEPDELKPQFTYRFFGKWKDNERFGPQFVLDTWTPAKPHGRAGVVKYLQQCPHIGEATAVQLWNEFNSEAVRICREHPEIIAAKIKRLDEAKAREVAEALAEMADLENTSIDLIELLSGRYFPKATAREAIRVWGARAPAIIQADPYKLMRFRGCGFTKCDQMYLDLGLAPNRMKRQVCCAWHAIATDRNGHVWMPISSATEGVKAKISGVEVEPDKAVAIAKRFGALATRRDCRACRGSGQASRLNLFTGEVEVVECAKCRGSGGAEWIAENRKAVAESRVVAKLADMLKWERHWPSIEGRQFDSLTPHQREELGKATSGAVGTFCGSPGSGKSWSLAALVRAIMPKFGAVSIAVCAPTGKAAQRAKEAMRAHGINVEATTIHRLLGVEKADDGDGGWSFVHNERNHLPYQFIICDEASMVGLGLMSSLLAAVARGTNVLFVGDINQLLPVEYGAPLRDMLGLVPYGELKEIHRNAGSIVKACAAIRDSRAVMFDREIELEPDCPNCCEGAVDMGATCQTCGGSGKVPPRNLVMVNAEKDMAQRRLVELVKQLAAEKCGTDFDPIRDIQVLVAVNKKSDLSRRTLNPLLQEALNPNGRTVQGTPFRVGDKVMATKNGFIKLSVPGSAPKEVNVTADGKVLVCNGEFGRVLQVDPKKTVVEFPGPSRVVVIPKGKSDDGAKRKNEKSKEGDDTEGGDESGDGTGCDLVLGYAVTVHKCQGSSAHTIVVALDEFAGATGPYGVADRAWVYTAISRAERRCYMVGKRSTMTSVCARVFIAKRKTFTRELLESAIKDDVLTSGGDGDVKNDSPSTEDSQ